MALAETERILTVAAVVVVILVVLLYNNRMAKRPQPSSEEDEGPDLLLRFVQHRGSVVGETVAVDGDHIILKQAGIYKSVPKAQVQEEGGELVIAGDVDWDESQRRGATWYASHSSGHDPKVTEELTRSEDVQTPALQALERRGKEGGVAPEGSTGDGGADGDDAVGDPEGGEASNAADDVESDEEEGESRLDDPVGAPDESAPDADNRDEE